MRTAPTFRQLDEAKQRSAPGYTPSDRDRVLDALAAFIRKRPGLDYRNYASSGADVAGRAAYVSECWSIARDLREARVLLNAVRWRESITYADILQGFRAFSGRLTWDGTTLDYCTGQYWPTEYRKAVCAVLASVLWEYWRKDCPTLAYSEPDNEAIDRAKYRMLTGFDSPGDYLRGTAVREFGRAIGRRWFN